jgi:hypothetical protein
MNQEEIEVEKKRMFGWLRKYMIYAFLAMFPVSILCAYFKIDENTSCALGFLVGLLILTLTFPSKKNE